MVTDSKINDDGLFYFVSSDHLQNIIFCFACYITRVLPQLAIWLVEVLCLRTGMYSRCNKMIIALWSFAVILQTAVGMQSCSCVHRNVIACHI